MYNMDNIMDNKNLLHALRKISPGTPLRQGLDNVLRAKTGGLIVQIGRASCRERV